LEPKIFPADKEMNEEKRGRGRVGTSRIYDINVHINKYII